MRIQDIVKSIEIDADLWDKPIGITNPKKGIYLEHPELDAFNPYSPVACLTMYLYSMEFGSPPLYAEANRAARDKDESLLKQLGPFARVLHKVCAGAEDNKQGNKIPIGKSFAK